MKTPMGSEHVVQESTESGLERPSPGSTANETTGVEVEVGAVLSQLSRSGGEALSDAEVAAFTVASEALEADPGFQRLTDLLHDFNLFEALGMVRQELRHSHLLAFLLHPNRSHGLGGALLQALCQDKEVVKHLDKALHSRNAYWSAASSPTSLPVTSVRRWDWSGAMVIRESEDLDLLVVDQALGLALIIENKIDAGEHDDQLARYLERVGERYPNLAVAGLFLTPQGTPPSDKRYLPVSYTWICQAIETLRDRRLEAASLSTAGGQKSITTKREAQANRPGVAEADPQWKTNPHANPKTQPALSLLLTHYIQLLRRHIVDHPELPDLCNQLYARHAPLLDLLFEHRGDDETRLYRAVQTLVLEGAKPRSPHKLVVKSPRKTIYPKFGLREWEALSTQANGGEALDRSALYFEFNFRGALRLALLIGPHYVGKPEVDALRERVLLAARQSQALFKSGSSKVRSAAGQPLSVQPLSTQPLSTIGFLDEGTEVEEEADEERAGGSAASTEFKPNAVTTIVWRQTWISPKKFEAMSLEERLAELEQRWEEFLANDLPLIRAALPAEALRPSKTIKAGETKPKDLKLKDLQADPPENNRLKTDRPKTGGTHQ